MSTKILVEGDLTESKFYVGEPYTMRYQPTIPLARTPTGNGGEVADYSGRLQLRTLSVNYSRTGAFTVTTRSLGREPKITEFQPRRTTVQGNPLDFVKVAEGSLRVLAPGNVREMTIEISNSSFLPSTLTSAEWEGFYVNRGQRI